VFTSNLISQTTWLKVKLKLVMDVFFFWLVFTSNLISQTTWLKVKLKLVIDLGSYPSGCIRCLRSANINSKRFSL